MDPARPAKPSPPAARTLPPGRHPRRRRRLDLEHGRSALPQTTHIVDTYLANEHLRNLANCVAFITPDRPQWLADRLADFDAGNIQTWQPARWIAAG